MDSLICQVGMAASSQVHGRMQLNEMSVWTGLHTVRTWVVTQGRGSWENRFSSGFCFQHLLVQPQAHSYPSQGTL